VRLWPWAGSPHGPLPSLLVMLTVVTGLVDAVSFIALGHVFVANMTGNVVFVGFALAGAPGLSLSASLTALGAFLVGAVAGGQIGKRIDAHRGRHLAGAGGFGVVLIVIAAVVATVNEHPRGGSGQYALIILLASAMGIQNATARRLAVPDLTTTVLTQTLTGLAADSPIGAARGNNTLRRAIPVVAMLGGAFVGALAVLHVGLFLPLAAAAALTATAAALAFHLGRGDPPWTKRP